MIPLTALILDGHSRAATETLQSLGRAQAYVDVSSVNIECVAFKSRYVRNCMIQPEPASRENFINWLQTIESKHNYDLIVPSTEASLKVFTALEEDSPIREKAILPTNRSIAIALNKMETIALAKDLDIPVPATFVIRKSSRVSEIIRYPIVLKSMESLILCGEKFITFPTTIVFSPEQLRKVLNTLEADIPIIAQEFVHGYGVGIEMIYVHGRKGWHFCHERIHELPLSGGASTYRRSITPPVRLLKDAELLLDQLQWHGVAMVEFKVNSSGSYALMEINPRLWGSLALSIDAGVNFPQGLARLACGDDLGPQPNYRLWYYTRNLASDPDWILENIRANRSQADLLTHPPFKTIAEYLRPLMLKESWDHFDWYDLAVIRAICIDLFRRYLNKATTKLRMYKNRKKITRQHNDILRTLSLSPSSIRCILILCYGNICRSPFAHRYFVKQIGSRIACESAGFFKTTGRQSPMNILQSAIKFDIDLGSHRSKGVNRQMTDNADLILVMDEDKFDLLHQAYPYAAHKATALGLFLSKGRLNIKDPYGSDSEETDRVLVLIMEAIDNFIGLLNKQKAV